MQWKLLLDFAYNLTDVLPPLIRAAFETRLQEAAVTDTECSPGKSEPSSPKPQQGTRRGSLLGYLFGSDSLEDGMSEAASEVRGRDSAEALARVKASRWDAGYEALIAAGEGDDGDSGRPALLLRDPYGLHVFPTLPVSGDLSEILWGGVGSASLAALDGGKSGEGNLLVTPNSADKDQEKRTKEDTVMDRSSRTSAALATQRLRRGVREAGATSLVSDTRFYSVPALVLALQALSDCATCGCLESAELSMQVAVTAGSASASEQLAEILQTSAEDAGRAAPSAASRAWFEQLLSEAVVRNRDRIGALWPILERHYSLQLRPPRFGLTYGTERALVGLLKVAERVLARQGVAEPMMALFGRLFQAPAPMVIEAVTVKVAAPTRMLRQEEEPVLRELAGHVSSGVWRLLTKNVDVLPLLTSVQWDVLFHLLAISASASAYAAVKVFESLAWLLHEPRLRANVPLTVTQCVVPLVLNRRAPSTVSTGAVQLLLRLHERLEVFATDAAVARSALPEQDAEHMSQTLWDSSWVPLLTALVAGVQRRRGRVQRASVRALERTLRDRHALAAPPRVLMWVLAGLLVPTVQQLATQRSTRRKSGRTQTPSSQYLHDNEQGELISDANEETSSIASEEENDESQQQWELGASLGSESPVPSSIVVTPVRDAVHRALHSLGDAGVDSGEAMEDPLCVVLATLSEAFVRQPKKLAAYPSFDQLWLRLLQLLSLLLGPEEEEACTTEPPSGPEGSAGLGRAWVSLTPAAEAALHSLQSCLAALHSAGLLQQKQGLRVVSREMVRGMSLLQRVAATDAQTAAALALL